MSISTKAYLLLLSICLGLVGIWVVLQELSYVSHYGFLIRLVHIHICNKNKLKVGGLNPSRGNPCTITILLFIYLLYACMHLVLV